MSTYTVKELFACWLIFDTIYFLATAYVLLWYQIRLAYREIWLRKRDERPFLTQILEPFILVVWWPISLIQWITGLPK